eukprot:207068_1
MVTGVKVWIVSFCIMVNVGMEIDVLFKNGRVIDPETHMDAILDVAVQNDKIVFIGSVEGDNNNRTFSVSETIDISNYVLVPGFIDIHSHHQTEEGNRLQARDGVTTSMELEFGTFPVSEWYSKRQKKGSLLNYGVSTGHIMIRMTMRGIPGHQPFIDSVKLPKGDWSEKRFDEQEMNQMLKMFEDGLNAGSLGIGLGIEYVKDGATLQEIEKIFQMAQKYDTIIFVHVRESGEIHSFLEVIRNSKKYSVNSHIMHVASSSADKMVDTLKLIHSAIDDGVGITTEVYPYCASSTFIESKVYDKGWQHREGITYSNITWVQTGEKLTERTFEKYRKTGGIIMVHFMKDKYIDLAIKDLDIIIASDGIPFMDGKGHPRGSGTFSRILSHYVRKRELISLPEAIRKMSYLPAKLLGKISDDFKLKGRIQIDMDADITIFDPLKVEDMGKWTRGAIPSEGIMYVQVNGEFVVKNQELVTFDDLTKRPGKGLKSKLYDIHKSKNEL